MFKWWSFGAPLSAAMLTVACGGGGGGDGTGGSGGAGGGGGGGPATGTRQASLSYDFDNNGVADAVTTLIYDAEGRPTERRYVYSGDGTADRFDPFDDQGGPVVDRFTYDAQSRLQSWDAGGLVFSYTYGVDGLATRVDATSPVGRAAAEFIYSGNLRTQALRTLEGNLVATDIYEYDGQGRRVLTGELNPDGTVFEDTRYAWDGNGRLTSADVAFDADSNGPSRYVMAYAGGLQVSTIKTYGNQPGYSVAFSHDTGGRLLRIEFDLGSNGSVDAVWTMTWESGPCRPVRLPDFDPLMDSISGYGSSSDGTVSNCGP